LAGSHLMDVCFAEQTEASSLCRRDLVAFRVVNGFFRGIFGGRSRYKRCISSNSLSWVR
jgi:hypothetical protein